MKEHVYLYFEGKMEYKKNGTNFSTLDVYFDNVCLFSGTSLFVNLNFNTSFEEIINQNGFKV